MVPFSEIGKLKKKPSWGREESRILLWQNEVWVPVTLPSGTSKEMHMDLGGETRTGAISIEMMLKVSTLNVTSQGSISIEKRLRTVLLSPPAFGSPME